jgi:hypothetical protein
MKSIYGHDDALVAVWLMVKQMPRIPTKELPNMVPLLLITLRIPCCILYHYVRFNDKCTHMSYWQHYLHYVVCQITMSDLIVNAHTCFTDSTIYTLVHVRSICLIYGWMQTYMLLITLLTPRCLWDLSVWFNEKFTHMFKWKHYLHNVVCQINKSV